jgi:hypothetical protein
MVSGEINPMNWTETQIRMIFEMLIADLTPYVDIAREKIGKVEIRFIVFRMLQAMAARQTATEYAYETTNELNGRGFNAADARKLTELAKLTKSRNFMTGFEARYAARFLLKYSGQLAQIAAYKAAKAA